MCIEMFSSTRTTWNKCSLSLLILFPPTMALPYKPKDQTKHIKKKSQQKAVFSKFQISKAH